MCNESLVSYCHLTIHFSKAQYTKELLQWQISLPHENVKLLIRQWDMFCSFFVSSNIRQHKKHNKELQMSQVLHHSHNEYWSPIQIRDTKL